MCFLCLNVARGRRAHFGGRGGAVTADTSNGQTRFAPREIAGYLQPGSMKLPSVVQYWLERSPSRGFNPPSAVRFPAELLGACAVTHQQIEQQVEECNGHRSCPHRPPRAYGQGCYIRCIGDRDGINHAIDIADNEWSDPDNANLPDPGVSGDKDVEECQFTKRFHTATTSQSWLASPDTGFMLGAPQV